MDRRASSIYPGERMFILAEPRREGRAGPSAVVSVLGAAFGTWILLSAPQQSSLLGTAVVPHAEAASLVAETPIQPHRLNRAGPIQEAQADTMPKQDLGTSTPPGQQMMVSTPLTHDDLVIVQERLKALGYDPGTADGRPGKRTLEALNEYRKSLGLQETDTIDRQAVSPLTP
jgi:hypothetical protein